MCGRFVQTTPSRELATLFDLGEVPDQPPRYNIAPSQWVLAIRQSDGKRQGVLLGWGLVPPWADDPSIGSRLINARVETAAQKAVFREAYRRRRCLVPADGFYEWQGQGRRKQPFFIRGKEGRILAMAGLWEYWQDTAGNVLETCTLLTRPADGVVRPIHDRMPVILQPEQWTEWLAPDTSLAQIETLLERSRGADLEAYAVSPRVNRPGADDPSCVEPLRPGNGSLFEEQG